MNVQYALKDGEIYVLEVNPRASRTVPFVAKVIGQPIAKIAVAHHGRREPRLIQPAARGQRSRRRQGIGLPFRAFPRRRYRARPGNALDRRGHRPRPLLRHRFRQKPARRRHESAALRHRLHFGARQSTSPASSTRHGFSRISASHLTATGGTARFLQERGLSAAKVNKVSEGRPHVVDAIKNGAIQLVFNTTEGAQALTDFALAAAGRPLA